MLCFFLIFYFALPFSAVLGCNGVDLVFLVDTSRSIWEVDFKRQLKFMEKVISKFEIGSGPKQTRVGVILFTSTFSVPFHLRTYSNLSSIQSALKRIRYKAGSRTRTDKVFKFLRKRMFKPLYGGRKTASKVAVLISDGKFHKKRKSKKEALKAKLKGIKIFTIGVGKRVDMKELRNIASDPDEQFVFHITDFKALDRINYKIPTTYEMCTNRN